MRTADSKSNLLQKTFDSLPIVQRAAGDIKLGEFVDALFIVNAIVPTPERDKIIAVQSLAANRTVTGANTQIIHTTDRVPAGEIHRYLYIGIGGSAGTSSVNLTRINATPAVGIVISDRIAAVSIGNTGVTNLLGLHDLDGGSAISLQRFTQLIDHIDVYPGGFLQIVHSSLAVAEVSSIRLLRIRMHGPREAFNEDRSTALNFIEA